MHFRVQIAFGLGACFFMLGCGTLDPALKVETFGIADPSHDKQLVELAQSYPQVPPILVTQGEIPEGMDLTEDGTKLSILPGYEQRYQILGMVEGDYMAVKGVKWKNLLWTWKEYDSTAKKVACYAQAPLKLLTLSLWTYLPWAYPCLKFAPREESDRAAGIMNVMKRGAAAMGGNRVLITGKGNLSVTTISDAGSSTEFHNTVKIRGFVLLDRAQASVQGVPQAEMTSQPGVQPQPAPQAGADF